MSSALGSSQSSRSRMVSKGLRMCLVEPGLMESRVESWVKTEERRWILW